MNEITQLRDELIRLDKKHYYRSRAFTDGDWLRLENVLDVLYLLDPLCEEELLFPLYADWFTQYKNYLELKKKWKRFKE